MTILLDQHNFKNRRYGDTTDPVSILNGVVGRQNRTVRQQHPVASDDQPFIAKRVTRLQDLPGIFDRGTVFCVLVHRPSTLACESRDDTSITTMSDSSIQWSLQ